MLHNKDRVVATAALISSRMIMERPPQTEEVLQRYLDEQRKVLEGGAL
jgi:hypothetical protein